MHLNLLLLLGLLTLGACTGRQPKQVQQSDQSPPVSRALLQPRTFASGQTASDSMANYFEQQIATSVHSGNRAATDSLLLQYINQLYELPDSMNLYNNRLQEICEQIIQQRALAPDSENDAVLARAYFERADNLNSNSQYFKAHRYMQQYLQSKVAAKKPVSLNYIKSLSGDIYTRFGDNRQGLTLLEEAFRSFTENADDYSRASAAQNCVSIANHFNIMRQYGKARQYIDSGFVIAARISNESRLEKAKAIIKLRAVSAEQYIETGNLPGAERETQYGIQEADRFKDAIGAQYLAEQYAIRSDSYFRKKMYNEARSYCLQAIQLGEPNSRETGKRYLSLGLICDSLALPDSALHYYHIALGTVINVAPDDVFSMPQPDSLYAENTIMEALDHKAAVFEKKYVQTNDARYLQYAVQYYQLAFRVAALLMQEYNYDEAKLDMSVESRKRSEKAMHNCYQLYRLNIPGAWVEKALQFEENSKAILLFETVRSNIAASMAGGGTDAEKQVRSLQRDLLQIKKELLQNGADSAAKTYLLNEKNKAENKLEYYRANPAYHYLFANNLNPGDSISIAHVKDKLLRSNTSLIEYFMGDAHSYAIAINPSGDIQMIQLHAHTRAATDSFRTLFANPAWLNSNPVVFQQAAYTLYQLLIEPLQVAAKSPQLLIIPDGVLAHIPFDALITAPGNALNWQSLPYLAKQTAVALGFSTATLLQQSAAKTDYPQQALGIAPVYFNAADSLHHTLSELDALQQHLPGKFYTQEKASADTFCKAVATDAFEVLHIATHAYADTMQQRQPFLLFRNDTLPLKQVYTLNIQARLVVLSACQTAIGHQQPAEGVISLARGFYYAGAKELVTSLWNVDDKATAALFGRFYKNAVQHNYTAALHDAKRGYLQTPDMDNKKYSPYYWAGFVKIGISDPVAGSGGRYMLLLLLPLVLLAGFLSRKKMRTVKKQRVENEK